MPNSKKQRGAGPLAILFLLLIMVIVLIVVVRSCSAPNTKEDPQINKTTESQAPVESENIIIPPESPSPSPSESPSPSPSPLPSESPSPSPLPTPSSTPAVPVSAAGTIISNTGTPLNVWAEWKAYSNDSDSVTLEVELFVESYSLNVGPIYSGGIITVGAQSATFDTPAVEYDGEELMKHSLGKKTFTIPYSGEEISLPIVAGWNFSGTYGDTEFESISAAGLVVID